MERPKRPVEYPPESAQMVKNLLQRYRRNEGLGKDPDGPQKGNYTWPACKDFTIEKGRRLIADYIETWELKSDWLHSLEFLCTTEEEHRTFHHYRARFSTPTAQRPVLSTASVYFTVDLSKVKPLSLPLHVHFVVEAGRLVHTPGRTMFQEKWLEEVIERKTELRRAVGF